MSLLGLYHRCSALESKCSQEARAGVGARTGEQRQEGPGWIPVIMGSSHL